MSVNVLTPRSTEGGQRSSDRAHICLTCFGSCLGVTLCRVKFAKKIDESVPAVLECREVFEFATRFKVLNVNGSLRTPIQAVVFFETLQANLFSAQEFSLAEHNMPQLMACR